MGDQLRLIDDAACDYAAAIGGVRARSSHAATNRAACRAVFWLADACPSPVPSMRLRI